MNQNCVPSKGISTKQSSFVPHTPTGSEKEVYIIYPAGKMEQLTSAVDVYSQTKAWEQKNGTY